MNNSMTRVLRALLVAVTAALLQACGSLYATTANPHGEEVMLLGYDPVAYFTTGKPARGTNQFKVALPGRTYYFASEAHQRLFQAAPDKYEPLYGGFCANGAPYKIKLGSDPTEWEIVNGRLFIFGDILGHEMWKLHRDDNIANADRVWPEIRERGWRGAAVEHIIFNRVPWYRDGKSLHAEYERQNPGKKLTYDPGGMFTNFFLKRPGWRAAEGFGQPVLGYPD